MRALPLRMERRAHALEIPSPERPRGRPQSEARRPGSWHRAGREADGTILMKRLASLSLICAIAVGSSSARAAVWKPSPGHAQVRIWPGAVPDAAPTGQPEQVASDWAKITDVSEPTLTVYSPQGKNTGVAIVVFPGGGYQMLAMDLEGTEICDWLVSRGITCVLSKYRVPHSGPYWDKVRGRVYPPHPVALEDAQRTVSLVRFHAAEWHIDPHKIGVMGFSAGGHIVAGVSTHFAQRTYAPVDAADKESCRPDFAIAAYPGHLWSSEDKSDRSERDSVTFALRPDIHIPPQTPPTFIVMAEDDRVDGVGQALAYYIGLKNAGVAVETHLYAQGGHAFGLRAKNLPVSEWPLLVEKWLHTIGML